ncbi:MAG: hypothetical protein E6Y08_22170 [Paenibacillus sp.]|uniref:hypothetical protein n=1 Tax=Paenibacillus sp. TaxID=58172 RepID=UPI00290B922D|nr:hypothetical protein [Paenibacillus sp.]MDU4698527.1 hypothetical protein [Paenibacillus sp.]
MKFQLIQDAYRLLQGELSPEAGIQIDLPYEEATPLADLLLQYDMTPALQRQRLSIYIAIKLAMQRHSECSSLAPGEALTRKVLDGDYLYSFYVELCLKWEEFDLLVYLAPIIKQLQIKRVEGRSEDERLLKAWELFLQLENNRSTATKAM